MYSYWFCHHDPFSHMHACISNSKLLGMHASASRSMIGGNWIHMRYAGTLTRSQRLEVWGRCLSPDNGCMAISQKCSPLPRCVSHSSRAAALWRIRLLHTDLSSVEEWIKRYCQRKTAVRFFENGSAYRKRTLRKVLPRSSSSTCL